MPQLNPSNQPVDIRRACYTMATVDGEEAEIVMCGDIVQQTPRDWQTGESIEGSFIALDEFLKDLKEVEGVQRLVVRLNSCGGDAFAAIPIHNRLRALSAKVIVIVDGVAMSGGSLIMCAADTVRVNPSSLIMIHKCWCFLFGGYGADELRKIVASTDATDKAQAAIYMRKTGMNEAAILSMMSDETYMTGLEAVNRGFADALTEDEAPLIAASADRRTLFVNGRAMHFKSPLSGLPEWVAENEELGVRNEELKNEVAENEELQGGVVGNEELGVRDEELKNGDAGNAEPIHHKGGKTMATTLEELKAENAELYEKLVTEARAGATPADEQNNAANVAAAAERDRIKEIDEVAGLFTDEIVREAKYGKNPCTARELTYRAAKEATKKGQKFLTDMVDDTQASGAQNVQAAHATPEEVGDTEVEAQAAALVRKYLETRGGKKSE